MSLLSDVQICNLALDAIATRSTITSLQENSKEAKACARHYPAALASCLGAAHWNFARAEASLSLLKDASKTPPDVVPTPWIYEYAYPSDCLGGRYVKPLMQATAGSVPGAQSLPYATGSAVKFLVSTDLDSQANRVKVILTNQPAAQFVYTTLITDTSLFDESFVTALWNYLAHLLARPLSGDKTLAKQCYEFAQATCNKAQADNGNEGLTVVDVMPDWMRVRGYTDDWQYPIGSYTVMAPQSLASIS